MVRHFGALGAETHSVEKTIDPSERSTDKNKINYLVIE